MTTNGNDWWLPDEKAWGKGIVTKVLCDHEIRVESSNNDSYEYDRMSFEVVQREKYAFQFCCD